MEEWRPIKDYEGFYEISDQGQVKSLKFNKKRILKPKLMPGGYIQYALSSHKLVIYHYVHTLVLEAFVSLRPFAYVCDHIDSNKQNNCLKNLEWVTPEENTRRMRVNKPQLGSNSPHSKLTEEKVKEIRERYKKESITQRELGEEFEVVRSTITYIVNRKTWAHIA